MHTLTVGVFSFKMLVSRTYHSQQLVHSSILYWFVEIKQFRVNLFANALADLVVYYSKMVGCPFTIERMISWPVINLKESTHAFITPFFAGGFGLTQTALVKLV